MKILILNWRDITHPQSGGAESFIHELGRRLAYKNEVTLFCAQYRDSKKEETIDGIRIRRMGNRFSVYIRAALAFRKNRYDLVIDDINGVPFFSPFYSDAQVVPVVHHLMDKEVFKRELSSLLGSVGYAFQSLIPKIYRNQRFVVVSDSTKQEVLEKFRIPSSRVSIVHCGVSVNSGALVEKSRQPVISYVGRLKPYKRVDNIIRAFSMVLAEVPDAQLIIAGRGDDSELRVLASDLRISSSVRFCGEISEREKAAILSESWISMMASVKEGWGIGPMEANACGTPVVCYNVPGIRDSMRHGHTAVLVEDGRVDLLAEAALNLIQNDAERSRMSREAKEWASKFTWDDTAAEFLAVLSKNPEGHSNEQSSFPIRT